MRVFFFSRPPLGVSTSFLHNKYFFIGTQAVNFRPSTDRHEIFTHNSGEGREDDLRFEILIFDPQKFGGGKPQNCDKFGRTAVNRKFITSKRLDISTNE